MRHKTLLCIEELTIGFISNFIVVGQFHAVIVIKGEQRADGRVTLGGKFVDIVRGLYLRTQLAP